MKFNPEGTVKTNLDTIKTDMKKQGYYFSGTRRDDDDIRLVFEMYLSRKPYNVKESNIAISYAKLNDTTKSGTFHSWWKRAKHELFEKEEVTA